MVTACVAARGCNRGGRGGWGGGNTPDFKWQGWSNGAKNQNPKKALDRNLTLKNSHAEFPSHKISVTDKRIQQKRNWSVDLHPRTPCRLFWLIGILTKMQRNALNIKTVTKQVWFYFIRGTTCTRPGYARTITNLQIVLILNTPQNPCLLIKLPKKYLTKFSYPKKSRNRKFKPKKILRPSALSLEIRSTPRLPMAACSIPANFFPVKWDWDLRDFCLVTWTGFPKLSQRFPRISDDFPKTPENVRTCSGELWPLPKPFN